MTAAASLVCVCESCLHTHTHTHTAWLAAAAAGLHTSVTNRSEVPFFPKTATQKLKASKFQPKMLFFT